MNVASDYLSKSPVELFDQMERHVPNASEEIFRSLIRAMVDLGVDNSMDVPTFERLLREEFLAVATNKIQSNSSKNQAPTMGELTSVTGLSPYLLKSLDTSNSRVFKGMAQNYEVRTRLNSIFRSAYDELSSIDLDSAKSSPPVVDIGKRGSKA